MRRSRNGVLIPLDRHLGGVLLAAALTATAWCNVTLAASNVPAETLLFSTTDVLDVELTLPWQEIVTDEFFFQGPFTAELEWSDSRGRKEKMPLKVWRRGNSRQVLCRFPPIKLVFDTSSTRDTVFSGQKSLKLVTPCDKGSRFGQYVVLEELAYRMFNQFSELSFRVRPLTLTLHDSGTGRTHRPIEAFLIEDDSDLARRNGRQKIKQATVEPRQLDSDAAARMSLFEFLVGNTHWALQASEGDDECCHNVQLISGESDAAGSIVPVPEDFDGSGLVNAPYARPQAGLPVTAVTQRLYQGSCAYNAALPKARKQFQDAEPAIRSLVEENQRLTPESKSSTLAFLGTFFSILGNDARFQAETIGVCRR